ncbi:MAG TPA: molybdate ABC transporter substrate-binding protein [Xanthobacteraceae bacterium]|jgi:molybdate transport system substrate-binding protein
MSEINVLASTALKPTLDDVLPEFERINRHAVTLTFAPSAQIVKQVAAGGSCDVILATGEQFDELVRLGKVVAKSRKDIARSVIGVAVRADAAKPDISTVENFKQALLAAKSIATSNPNGGGASGPHLEKVFTALGIADAIKSKLTYGPGGPNGLIGNFVRTGQVELGLQQIPELMSVPGITVVGTIPPELQMETVYSVGLTSDAKDPKTGTSFVSFLSGAEVATVLKEKGMTLM